MYLLMLKLLLMYELNQEFRKAESSKAMGELLVSSTAKGLELTLGVLLLELDRLLSVDFKQY